jgi:predicted HTH domain antitoxin
MTLSEQDELNIVEAYKRGDTLKQIYADFPGLYSKLLYDILEKYNVPKRGRQTNFKKIWEDARAKGKTPAGLPFNPNGKSSKTKKSTKAAKLVKIAPTAGLSVGAKLIKHLLDTGAVTQADINSLSTVSSASKAVVSPAKKTLSAAQIRSREKRQNVIDLYRQGSFSIPRIAKITGVGLSTAQRYIKEHKG